MTATLTNESVLSLSPAATEEVKSLLAKPENAGKFLRVYVEKGGCSGMQYGLTFERFLNPERIQMPDIDMDFADDRRDEVIQYVIEKYGSDRVAQIITFGRLLARAAIRDVGRALDYPLKNFLHVSQSLFSLQ